MLIFTLFLQVYVVAGGEHWVKGGEHWDGGALKYTEILEKDGGSAWKLVASLPSARGGIRGVGLDHGRFIITGECWTIINVPSQHNNNN